MDCIALVRCVKLYCTAGSWEYNSTHFERYNQSEQAHTRNTPYLLHFKRICDENMQKLLLD